MSRRLPLIAPLLLLLSFAAPSALAQSQTQVATLAAEDVELVPLDQVQQQLLFLRNRKLVERLTHLGNRAKRLGKRLVKLGKEKKQKQVRETWSQLQEVRSKMQPLLAELQALLREEGVEEEAFRRLKGFPTGPRRPLRYAHSLVPAVKGLDPKRKALLTELVASVDGAQLALIAQRKRLERGAKDAERKELIRATNRQINRMERRFWRMIDYLLDPAEKREVRKYLPHSVSKIDDALQHALRLPGLTPSQGSRIHAILAELEAESAADQAEVRRLQVQLRARDLPQSERQALREQLHATRLRVTELTHDIIMAGRAIMTPEQYDAFRSIPPFVNTNDRRQDLRRIVEGMDLSPEQYVSLKALGERIKGAKSELQGEMREIGRMSQDFGPDSPQMQAMGMMRMGVESKGQVVLRETAREMALNVLSPTQVVGWVVGLYGRQ